jgi:hypothetical protein
MIEVLLQYPVDNVAGSYATVGANSGTEDADYPSAYLADGRLGRPAKLTTTSGSWVFSYASAQRIDLVALGAHNLTSVTLEGNATNAWGSPSFSAALTMPGITADGHSVNAWLDLTTAAGYAVGGFQYWRLVVSGSVACAVGEVWFGSTRRAAVRNYKWGFTVSEKAATILHETEFLVPHVYALGSRQRQLEVVFNTTDAGALALQEWFRSMKGSGLTGLLIPNSETNDAWWVRQASDYAENAVYADYRDVSMTLVEHATGVPL